MASEYLVTAAAMQTTAAPAVIATGNAIKTLLQIAPNATTPALKIKEWGISFDGSAAATPIKVELIETDVAASVGTAFAAADITKVNDPDGAASSVQLGAALSCFAPGTEGSTTAVRNLDAPQLIAPTNQYNKQFSLGDEPKVRPGKFLRIRVTAPVTVNAYPYVKWEE